MSLELLGAVEPKAPFGSALIKMFLRDVATDPAKVISDIAEYRSARDGQGDKDWRRAVAENPIEAALLANAIEDYVTLAATDDDGKIGADELPQGWMQPDWGLAPPTPSDLPIKRGSKGDAVRWVQQKVGAAVDGSFGAGTATAVKNYQDSHGLKADGIVGPKTLAAMMSDTTPSIETQAAALAAQDAVAAASSTAATTPKRGALKKKLAAAAGGAGTCGAVSHTWQSSLALIVFLLLLVTLVHLAAASMARNEGSRQ